MLNGLEKRVDSIQIQPIGLIKNEIDSDDFQGQWGKVESELEIRPELAQGLEGLSDWSHIVVIYQMHQAHFDMEQDLFSRPMDIEGLPEIGIFAQRARQRPNMIGISAVRVLSVEGNIVRVKGLDALNNTPILDIKPYAPIYDGVLDPMVPGWFIRLMQGYF
ncbi:SAM-dependent methyltransferase [Anaerolineales bacterium]